METVENNISKITGVFLDEGVDNVVGIFFIVLGLCGGFLL